jgi:acetyltransferase-like isoleucine patch superfamily enzyme
MHVLRQEVAASQPRYWIGDLILRFIPRYCCMRLRTAVLRALGWKIARTSALFGAPTFVGTGRLRNRLTVGAYCTINVDLFVELNDDVRIGDRVAIGHEVKILTSTHHIGSTHRRAGDLITAPVRIGDGAWIGARCTILPGVTIGQGAVVGAGSVVSKDVPANSLVSGVPASVAVRRLPG